MRATTVATGVVRSGGSNVRGEEGLLNTIMADGRVGGIHSGCVVSRSSRLNQSSEENSAMSQLLGG